MHSHKEGTTDCIACAHTVWCVVCRWSQVPPANCCSVGELCHSTMDKVTVAPDMDSLEDPGRWCCTVLKHQPVELKSCRCFDQDALVFLSQLPWPAEKPHFTLGRWLMGTLIFWQTFYQCNSLWLSGEIERFHVLCPESNFCSTKGKYDVAWKAIGNVTHVRPHPSVLLLSCSGSNVDG